MLKLATATTLIAAALTWAAPEENTKFPPERIDAISAMMS